jgi:hypothetical protein
VVGTKEEREKTKKNPRQKKILEGTKSKKNIFSPHLVALCLDPSAFPKRL